MFDDEDVLGGLGFDDSPRGKPAPRRGSTTTDEDRGKGRSIMDDLLGAGSTAKHMEPPGSGGAGRSREFVLDKRYQKQERKCHIYPLHPNPAVATRECYTVKKCIKISPFSPCRLNIQGTKSFKWVFPKRIPKLILRI